MVDGNHYQLYYRKFMIQILRPLISLCYEQLFFDTSFLSSLIRPIITPKKLASSQLLQFSPSQISSSSRKRVTEERSLSQRQRWLWHIQRTFQLARRVKVSYLLAFLAKPAKIWVSSLRISMFCSQLKSSTNLVMIFWLRITTVAEFLSQQRLEMSQHPSLRISLLQLMNRSKVFSTTLYRCSVSVYSPSSAMMLPTILIAYFLISSFLECRAAMMAYIAASSLTIAGMAQSSLLLVSSHSVLNTISKLPCTQFSSALKDTFFSQVWLTSTHSCLVSVSTILRMSASLPMILLPAAMTAISRMSTELTLRYSGRSCQNSLMTACEFSKSFSSSEAKIQSDSQSMWPSISRLSRVLVRQMGLLLLRQYEMVQGAMGGRGLGMGFQRELMMACFFSGGQYFRQSSYQTFFLLRWKVSARERQRKCLALALSLFFSQALIMKQQDQNHMCCNERGSLPKLVSVKKGGAAG